MWLLLVIELVRLAKVAFFFVYRRKCVIFTHLGVSSSQHSISHPVGTQ